MLAQRHDYYPKETSSGPDYASYEDEYYYDDYGTDAMLGDVIYEKKLIPVHCQKVEREGC